MAEQSPPSHTFSGPLPHNTIRFLLAKEWWEAANWVHLGLVGLECPEPPEVRVQRFKVCQGMEKEQMTSSDLCQ